jgi:hypothetical protein
MDPMLNRGLCVCSAVCTSKTLIAFKGLKYHEPNYGIVIHGVPIAELHLEKMTDVETIKRLKENDMKPGTITKITPLRRKNDHNSDKVKLHRSIVHTKN